MWKASTGTHHVISSCDLLVNIKGLESTFFLFLPLTKLPHPNTPLASKQYIAYAVTIVPFSCPPREATLAARESYRTPGTPYKLFGNTYIIIYMSATQRFLCATAQYGTADIFLCGHLHHLDINGHPLRRHICIFLCGDIYIIGTSRNGNVWRSPSVARTRTMSNVFVFCFLCFVSFSRSFVNKD